MYLVKLYEVVMLLVKVIEYWQFHMVEPIFKRKHIELKLLYSSEIAFT